MLEQPPSEWRAPLWPLYSHLFSRIGPIVTMDTSSLVTSWYRTPSENARVGGHPESQHLFGFALDVATDDPGAFAQRARESGLEAIVEPDHVHVQIFPAGFLRSLGFFR